MLLNDMSYIITIRRQTMALRDSFRYREKKYSLKAERLNLHHEMFPSCGYFFVNTFVLSHRSLIKNKTQTAVVNIELAHLD